MSVGIDLGTTNCAVAFIDGETVQDYPIPQLVQDSTVEPRPTLPSFLYVPGRHAIGLGSLSLPWDEVADYAVGTYARDEGGKIPDRLVVSAKSWLSQEGLDRRAAILPWKGSEEVTKLSPVEVSSRYLKHIVQAWRFTHPGDPLEDRDVILTVPASFDAVARELTVEAARKAGLETLTLLEEPQAAFYSWLATQGEAWRTHVKVGDRVLVVDIGGGTCDFSLIEVSQQEGDLALERLAVGDHLLLGGDNMDLALAATVQAKLKAEGTKLDAWQFQVLTFACRAAKERLFADDGLDLVPVAIAGRGSSLIGGSVQTELRRDDVRQVLVEGFFPQCKSTDWAQRQRRFGLAEVGLAYESDPAISRHLARFLGQHKAHPTAVLFNGGVCKATPIRQRVMQLLNGWLEEAGAPAAKELPGIDLELAVARGAAWFGLVRQGKGIRIRGGTSRAYYIGVEVPRPAIPGLPPPIKAVCVAPLGMEEGTSTEIQDQEFHLVVGEQVEFPFLSSSLRQEDAPGNVIEEWEDENIEQISTVATRLEGTDHRLVPVRLQSVVTEIGTLELWCKERDGDGRWKLEFEVREAS